MKRFLLLVSFVGFFAGAYAQGPPNDAPRVEDHMWRKRVLMRIDCGEKVNKPFVTRENADDKTYTWTEGNSAPQFKKGMIYALLHEYREGNIVGYKRDTLDAPLTYEQFLAIQPNADADQTAGAAPASGGGEDPFGEFDGGEGLDSEFEGDFDGFDLGAELEQAEKANEELKKDVLSSEESKKFDELVSKYETYFEVIEDRIFDKNKSDMYYDVKYIRLVFTDPKYLPQATVIFHYDDAMQKLLDKIQWKNPNNDSDYRTFKEVVELRRFNSIDINVSGRQVLSLQESARRRDQQIEFEHNLWEF